MKKVQIITILIILCFYLTACDPGSYRYDQIELNDNVARVELIEYKNSEQKRFYSWVIDQSSKLAPLDLSKITVLETLDNDEIILFIDQLSQVSFLNQYYVYNSPNDICIRIIYKNNDFEILSCDIKNKAFGGYVGRYLSDGKVKSFVGSFSSFEDFQSLINNFFDYVIVSNKQ